MSKPDKSSFRKNEEGAVTADWVVLCAGLVLMAALISNQMHTGTVTETDKLADHMGSLR